MATHTQAQDLNSLYQPIGGLFSSFARMRAAADEPQLLTRVDKMGDVGQYGSTAGERLAGPTRNLVQGAGVGLDDQDTIVRSRGEALERYCSSIFKKAQFITATAEELGRATRLIWKLVP